MVWGTTDRGTRPAGGIASPIVRYQPSSTNRRIHDVGQCLIMKSGTGIMVWGTTDRGTRLVPPDHSYGRPLWGLATSWSRRPLGP